MEKEELKLENSLKYQIVACLPNICLLSLFKHLANSFTNHLLNLLHDELDILPIALLTFSL